MYLGSLVMWLSAPMALGSYFAWPAFALLIPFYVFRLLNEEKVLRKELPSYSEYCMHSRFRLVPFVWEDSLRGAAIIGVLSTPKRSHFVEF